MHYFSLNSDLPSEVEDERSRGSPAERVSKTVSGAPPRGAGSGSFRSIVVFELERYYGEITGFEEVKFP